VREEVQSHARFLGCNSVIGYTETNTIERKEGKQCTRSSLISSGLCIFTVTGTAAVLKSFNNPEDKEDNDLEKKTKKLKKKKKTKKSKGGICISVSDCNYRSLVFLLSHPLQEKHGTI
jgi:hypothetical protein